MTTGLRKVWEWPAYYGRSGYDLSRPILIFVAAEKMARLQNTTPTDASILDFKARLANRCKLFPGNILLRASILDFKARPANRCMVLPVYALQRAVILDFRPRLGNRCKDFPVYTLFRASILDFRPVSVSAVTCCCE